MVMVWLRQLTRANGSDHTANVVGCVCRWSQCRGAHACVLVEAAAAPAVAVVAADLEGQLRHTPSHVGLFDALAVARCPDAACSRLASFLEGLLWHVGERAVRQP